MVGGLALHQAQPFLPPPNKIPQISDQRPRDQSPCPPSLHQLKTIEDFKQAHAQFIKLGHDCVPRHAGDLLSACALSEWGSLEYSRSIFFGLEDPGTFDFNIMIRAHVNYPDPKTAVSLYQDMIERNVKPDNFTFPFVLKACAQMSAIRVGTQVHGHVLKFGYNSDVFVQTSLINLYGKSEEIDLSCRVFEQMGSYKTIASWSALLAAHTRMGLWSECLDLFTAMTTEGVRPDESALVSVLSSCVHLGMLGAGRSIHCSLLRNFTGLNVIVQTSLIDMYANCGVLEKGLVIFDGMLEKNLYTYSVVISGLAMHGDGVKALEIFSDMLRDGLEPDEAVYVGILSACSHAGLIEEGLHCFDRMRFDHRIEPTGQHYGCMVDLMGRAGRLEEACALIWRMPIGLPTDVAWRSLLSACKLHENLALAERAVGNLEQTDCVKAGDYVTLSNMYAKVGRWDDAARARAELANRGLSQVPGFSRVEVKGRLYMFISQDRSKPYSDEVYEMLHQIGWQLQFEGYRPDTSEVPLFDADEEEKRRVISGQSQKLAIAFALLNTSQSDSIRIVTNLRMSSECHTCTGLISKIFEREIVVRDRNRFHHFRQGACSCGDCW